MHFCNPLGTPVFINRFGKSLAKAQRGITFPPAPVSTLHQRLALFFDATGISTVAKASVITSMEMSARVIFSGSSGLFWLASQACIMTSSKAGSPSETPTSSAQHFGSSCLNLHRQELSYQVCVTEGTDHLELDVPFLLCICGEVTSIG